MMMRLWRGYPGESLPRVAAYVALIWCLGMVAHCERTMAGSDEASIPWLDNILEATRVTEACFSMEVTTPCQSLGMKTIYSASFAGERFVLHEEQVVIGDISDLKRSLAPQFGISPGFVVAVTSDGSVAVSSGYRVDPEGVRHPHEYDELYTMESYLKSGRDVPLNLIRNLVLPNNLRDILRDPDSVVLVEANDEHRRYRVIKDVECGVAHVEIETSASESGMPTSIEVYSNEAMVVRLSYSSWFQVKGGWLPGEHSEIRSSGRCGELPTREVKLTRWRDGVPQEMRFDATVRSGVSVIER